jgi:hypothetical protein
VEGHHPDLTTLEPAARVVFTRTRP